MQHSRSLQFNIFFFFGKKNTNKKNKQKKPHFTKNDGSLTCRSRMQVTREEEGDSA